MRLVLVTLVVLLAGCSSTPGEPEATGPPAPIFEHERSGHVPVQLIPGTWTRAGHRLELGVVDVVLDGRALGTYRAEMDGRRFETHLPGCPEDMAWSFHDGDLVLVGGNKSCPLRGRWTRG